MDGAILKPLSRFKVEFKEEDGSLSICINKIMNTLSFRKLAGKTQVILSISGPNVRTRLTHTIEVAKIARDICFELGLNEDLAEAIALAHDIGHTPFGHVGERTLREFMCGCNTLSIGKISEVLLENSGFKHNLQTFRVLKDIENIIEGNNTKIWPYILWGAADHTNMSYAKSLSGMEDELFISNEHCDSVYSCHFCNGDQCKYNNHNKNTENSSCKPWICGLSTQNKEQDYCPGKCYMATLWENKLNKENIEIYQEYKYFFDHPFPNIFYSSSFYSYFFKSSIENWFSIESLIVKHADEIAQRQEDLEDGINKGLVTLNEAKDSVIALVSCFNCDNEFLDILFQLETVTNPQQLGELIVIFYKTVLIDSTQKNVIEFQNENVTEEGINIFFLMEILYKIQNLDSKKSDWFLDEIKNLENPFQPQFKNKYLNTYFDINFDPEYFFCIIYDYLEKVTKLGDYSQKTRNILIATVTYLDKTYKDIFFNKKMDLTKCSAANFLEEINNLRNFLKNSFPDIYKDFFKKLDKKYCKYAKDLKLLSYYILTELVSHNKNPILKVSDIYHIENVPLDLISTFKNNKDDIYHSWEKDLKISANRVLANLVDLCWDKDPDYEKKKTAFKEFKKRQKNTILKSEIVEKNDGKASYILRKLFRAYFRNIHQLPDDGLKLLFFSLKEKDNLNRLIHNEKIKFEELLKNLKGVIIDSDPQKKIMKINEICTLKYETAVISEKEKKEVEAKAKKGCLNEIKSLIDEKISLYGFLINRIKNNEEINRQKNYCVKDSPDLRQILREFRAILDNPILPAVQFWNNLVIRGICDYIASLTDQEAINEYEKLYSGIMELA